MNDDPTGFGDGFCRNFAHCRMEAPVQLLSTGEEFETPYWRRINMRPRWHAAHELPARMREVRR
jgi:hypothetical protein